MPVPPPRVITRYVEPPPIIEKPIIQYIEPPPIIEKPIIRAVRVPPPPVKMVEEPVVVSDAYYEPIVIEPEPSERFANAYPKRRSFSSGGKLDPFAFNDDSVYFKYNRRGAGSLDGYGRRARVIELDDNSAGSRSLVPVNERRGRYEPEVVNLSTDYFFGRRDFR